MLLSALPGEENGDVAHILGGVSMAGSCPHGLLATTRCFDCLPLSPAGSAYGMSRTTAPVGWECPCCHHVWNPSVLACHHCPEPPAFTAKGDAG